MSDDQSNIITEPDPDAVAAEKAADDARIQAEIASGSADGETLEKGEQSALAAVGTSVETGTGRVLTPEEQVTIERQREEERRRTRLMLQTNQQQDMGGLLMLLAFAFSALENGNESLSDENISEGFAKMLGLDVGTFRQTVTDVRSGTLSGRDAADRTFSSVDPSRVDLSRAPSVPMADLIRTNSGPTMLNPDLVSRMERDPTVRRYVQMTFEAAERHGLDGKLLANQFWQESHFNPNAGSERGAKGIAQFMPFHVGRWGIRSAADLKNPEISIEAGARFMRHLTDRFGSQQLALVAYNGGEKAVEWVDKRTPGQGITIADWMSYAAQQRAELGVGSRNLWRNQTYEYVAKIDSSFWDRNMIARAERQQGTALAAAGFGTGVDGTNRPVRPGVDGATVAFTHDVVTAGGTDQTALASADDPNARPGLTPGGAKPA
ncbi:MAG: lytic transglycosylase domain-containing protein [Alphaproteobacteria bacterium]|nr:lytic transglycosylase domain-containing protein [Alphaproteobacteria bacterium]MCB9975562.1 lytic transglycosylase domain-containing protein [Rhodospirillales bacterium]